MKALTEFNGFTINREDPKTISFGCGAVVVQRKDLLIVAEFLPVLAKVPGYKVYKAALDRLVSEWNQEVYDIKGDDVVGIGSKTLKQIAGV